MNAPLYDFHDIRHVYRGQTVLSIDRLELPRGGIVGVIGPNGSGKSTLLRLAGFVESPTSGEVRFDGRPAGPFAPEVRNRVALLPQEPFLMKRTVLNNVAYGHADPQGAGESGRTGGKGVVVRRARRPASSPIGPPTRFRAGKPSAWPWRRASSSSPMFCCWTSPPPASMP